MNALSAVGEYRLTSDELTKVREHFTGYSTSEEECLAEVKKVYEKHRLLIDTHTAVATHAANRYMSENKSTVPMLVVSTASAYKFASDVYFALTGKRSLCDLKSPLMLDEYTKVTMPKPLRRVLSKDAIHKSVINKDEMAGEVIAFAKGRK
jgi:threonine synthase